MDGMTTFPTSSNGCAITWHADLRWVQRAHEFECRPHRAWKRADPVKLQSGDFERVRYDEQTETLLCVNGRTLITVLSAEYETFSLPSDEKTQPARYAACRHSRDPSTDECQNCGSRFAAHPTKTSTQEDR
jgi:hypothetical protein